MHVKRVNHNPSNPISMPSTVIPLLSVRQCVYGHVFKSQILKCHCSLTILYFKQMLTDVTCILFNQMLVFGIAIGQERFTLLTRALGAATPQRRSVYLSYPLPHWCYSSLWSPGREIETDKEHTRQMKHETWKQTYISNIRLWSLQYVQS